MRSGSGCAWDEGRKARKVWGVRAGQVAEAGVAESGGPRGRVGGRVMTKSTRERRGAPRVVAKLAMQIAGTGGDSSVLTTESINLSAEGLQFQSKVALAPLTKVALTL